MTFQLLGYAVTTFWLAFWFYMAFSISAQARRKKMKHPTIWFIIALLVPVYGWYLFGTYAKRYSK